MSKQPIYILDSDVFITAKRSYYSFNICPGFWDSLIHHHKTGRIYSIDQVKEELQNYKTDDLLKWIRKNIQKNFFLNTDHENIRSEYETIMRKIGNCQQYYEPAKHEFARGADGWIIAYAKVNGFKVVTNEQPAPESKTTIKIPDVCKEFSVDCHSPFAMLEELQTKYHFLEGSGARPPLLLEQQRMI